MQMLLFDVVEDSTIPAIEAELKAIELSVLQNFKLDKSIYLLSLLLTSMVYIVVFLDSLSNQKRREKRVKCIIYVNERSEKVYTFDNQ